MISVSRLRLVACGAVLAAVAASVLVTATPAAAVPGVVVVSATSSTDQGGFKAARAFCPPGTVIIGGGGDVLGGGDSVHLFALRPEDNEPIVDSFSAGGMAHDPSYSPSAWSIIVWAICASGMTGHSVVRVPDANDPYETFSRATAFCPAGKRVIGTGGTVENAAFILDSVIVSPNLDSVTVEGYRTEYFRLNTGMDLAAYAVCVDPVPGLQRVSVISGYTSLNKVLTLACPEGTRIYGTGASLTGAVGQAYVEAVAPWGTYGAVLSAREDTTGHEWSWYAELYAICAR